MDAASSRRRQSHQDASVIVLSSDEDGPALLKKKAVRSKKPSHAMRKIEGSRAVDGCYRITSSEDDLPNESKSSSGLVDALQQQLLKRKRYENGKLRKSAEVGLQQLAEVQAENGRLRESAEVGLQQLVEAQAENGRLHKSAEVGLYPHDFWTIILTDIKSILEFRKRITS
ncbi:hypothetical protein A0H81_14984 [Grifola frondosa]|uniref:Uncharacterized protein n=1 Tax=Grifola frondosa TaxID=5627 RepID=A0A1C7LK04_GRIFR|nr:hypothetical protein A0H81_14984 [Grifola frondosa]